MRRPTVTTVVDLVVSVALIVASVVVIRGHWSPRQPPPQDGITLGTQLPEIEALSISDRSDTLIVALRTDCKFCTASLPFYKELTSSSRRSRIVVVAPDPADKVHTYLEAGGVKADAVVAGFNLGQIGVRGTPTILSVGPDRRIKAKWRGQIQDRKDELALVALLR